MAAAGIEQEEWAAPSSLAARPDPVVLELNRLHDQIKDKGRELGAAQSEIKALKASDALKDKALEELRHDVRRLEEKCRSQENLLEQKNLEIKKLNNEKRAALAAQYAAEATLRRVYADQKDDDSIPIESIIAPLEAEVKMYKAETAALQDDKKALERLTKSKEAALLEAERILRSALERALIVEEVQNQNFELKRRIEISQEENKILEKTNRQKVLEVEKLSQTIKELEEAVLAGGATANKIREYRRQITELQEERRTLERELARLKVSANRVATMAANEWKDENDKLMPVKQWLEERRLLQAEMERLREKLAVSERTAKAESQLKDKLKVRLKILEEGLKHPSNVCVNPDGLRGSPRRQKSNFFGILSSNAGSKKRSISQPRASTASRKFERSNAEKATISPYKDIREVEGLKNRFKTGESVLKTGLWVSRNKIANRDEKENDALKENTVVQTDDYNKHEKADRGNMKNEIMGKENDRCDSNDGKQEKVVANGVDDVVSGFLYDRLQKEVISLRKCCEMKDCALSAKDEEVKTLAKKIETLTKAIQVESKKLKREAAIRDKDTPQMKMEENTRTIRSVKRVGRQS